MIDFWVFLRECVADFKSTGALFPTTRFVADELTRSLNGKREPKKILEIGPATGSATLKILEKMTPLDTLMICEKNPRFMKRLKSRLLVDPNYAHHKARISFHLGLAEALPETTHFDLVVCSLPFLNFDVSVVRSIFSKLHAVANKGAKMTYYEHLGIRRACKAFSPRQNRHRLKRLEQFWQTIDPTHRSACRIVWRNLPPCKVYTLKLSE